MTTRFDNLAKVPNRVFLKTRQPTVDYEQFVRDYGRAMRWHAFAGAEGAALIIGAILFANSLPAWGIFIMATLGVAFVIGGGIGYVSTHEAHDFYGRNMAVREHDTITDNEERERPMMQVTKNTVMLLPWRLSDTELKRLCRHLHDNHWRWTRDGIRNLSIPAIPLGNWNGPGGAMEQLRNFGVVDSSGRTLLGVQDALRRAAAGSGMQNSESGSRGGGV
jgi:hypothetical protein